MRHLDPKQLSPQETNSLLLGGVAPRPIALVSTVSADGVPNLAPFSFFNAFGVNPPVVVFSPSRRVRDGSLKDTYHNLIATRECVIQSVTYDMVQQVSLASTEYPPDVNEFVKSGLTPIPSEIVKPARVAESPFQMECVLKQLIPMGEQNGSGNLAICEVVRFHISKRVFRDGVIDPRLIDLVGRNSKDYYTRASGEAIFSVVRPIERRGIGYDAIPQAIRSSTVLSANNLGQLGNVERIPSDVAVAEFERQYPAITGTEDDFRDAERARDYARMFRIARSLTGSSRNLQRALFDTCARGALDWARDTAFAWFVLLFATSLSRD